MKRKINSKIDMMLKTIFYIPIIFAINVYASLSVCDILDNNNYKDKIRESAKITTPIGEIDLISALNLSLPESAIFNNISRCAISKIKSDPYHWNNNYYKRAGYLPTVLILESSTGRIKYQGFRGRCVLI